MRDHGRWPNCTYIGCEHGRTPPSVATVSEDADQNTHKWISERGEAICDCHPVSVPEGKTRFPCDEGMR